MTVPLREVSEVLGDYSGLSRRVLEYCQLMKQLVDRAKKPDFTAASWAPLAGMIAVEEFERVGNFKEVMDWQQYLDFLTNWARSSEWECSFKRITEGAGVVFLELEERSCVGGYHSVVNSVSVYEFNAAGKIRHLDIYLQMAMPESEMPGYYEGIQIPG